MKHLDKNKSNVQEMNLSEMRITDGGILGAVFSKIKVTPQGVANSIDYAYKAYNIYTQVQIANNLPKPTFSPTLVTQVTK